MMCSMAADSFHYQVDVIGIIGSDGNASNCKILSEQPEMKSPCSKRCSSVTGMHSSIVREVIPTFVAPS